MACSRCNKGSKVLSSLRTFSVETVADEHSHKSATVYFTRIFNLMVNGVYRQYQPGQQVEFDYPTIYLILQLTPSSPAIAFQHGAEKIAFDNTYS